MNRKKRKEAGAIAIESILSLTFFLMTILALMMGTMLIRAQAAMQYALNQTAKEISGYFYLLDKFGIASAISGNSTEAAQASFQQLNDSIGHIVSFSGEIKDDVEGKAQDYEEVVSNAKAGTLTDADIERIKQIPQDAKETSEAIKNEVNIIKTDLKNLKNADKKEMFKGVLQVFSKALINTALSKYVTPPVCEALMPKYLSTRNLDNFYQQAGIIEDTINFEGSQMLADGRTISLVVTYQVDASKLTLGFYKKNLQFQQIASTCAWIHPNKSGSLLSLKDVDYFFDVARNEDKAEERNALREANEQKKREEEELRKQYQKTLSQHEADPDKKEEEKSEESKDDKDEEEEKVTLPPGVNASPDFQRAYDKLSNADKKKYNLIQSALKNSPSHKDLTEAINNCSDPDAVLQFILKEQTSGAWLIACHGEDGYKAYQQLDVNSRAMLLRGPISVYSPESVDLITKILSEDLTKITLKDLKEIQDAAAEKKKAAAAAGDPAAAATTPTAPAAKPVYMNTLPSKAPQKVVDAFNSLNDKEKEAFFQAITKCDEKGNPILDSFGNPQYDFDIYNKIKGAKNTELVIKFLATDQGTYTEQKIGLYKKIGNTKIRLGSEEKGDVTAEIKTKKVYEILSTEKGSRPKPETYLSQAYIDAHLKKFDGGITVLQLSKDYKQYTENKGLNRGDGTTFVMPKAECDRIFAEAEKKYPSKGDDYYHYLEDALGFSRGYFSDAKSQGGVVRLDATNISDLNVRIPSGNELGANGWWVPGGYTSGGTAEAVTDAIPFDRLSVKPVS